MTTLSFARIKKKPPNKLVEWFFVAAFIFSATHVLLAWRWNLAGSADPNRAATETSLEQTGLATADEVSNPQTGTVSEKPKDDMLTTEQERTDGLNGRTVIIISHNVSGPILLARKPRVCNCTDPVCINPIQCSRGIIQVHKMGVTLMSLVRTRYLLSVRTCEIIAHNTLGAHFENFFRWPRADYRHVVVTRNFYDALVSGYLYHKKHMECELDWFGKPGFRGWLLNNTVENWEKRIGSTPTHTIWPWPPGQGRDLCTYLSDVSEADGLRVYTEWAKLIYLDPLVSFVQARRRWEEQLGVSKTWYLCYERVLDQYVPTVQEMGRWFQVGRLMRPIVPPDDEELHPDVSDKYNNHSTSKDPDLLARLTDILTNLDERLYNGSIAQGNELFGCGRQY